VKPVEVRSQLVDPLRLDLVGPENATNLEAEVLPQAPSRWHLTGFLVPLEAGEAQRTDDWRFAAAEDPAPTNAPDWPC
jgi:hypothetical protein